tara:strand:- start:51 stop:317 length:267 start_codon:yes stop_codon:yes gene_type:complete
MGKIVTVGDKDIDQLEVKLFVTSLLLQELLDQTEGDTRFKHKLRHHINGMQNELDKVLSIRLDDNQLSLFVTDAVSALEDTIDSRIES